MKIHIIKRGKKVAVFKEGKKKVSKIFDYSEQAYYYAKRIIAVASVAKNKVDKIEQDVIIVVHNADGSIKFKEVAYESRNS